MIFWHWHSVILRLPQNSTDEKAPSDKLRLRFKCNIKCPCASWKSRLNGEQRVAQRAERWILPTTSGFKLWQKNANRANTSGEKVVGLVLKPHRGCVFLSLFQPSIPQFIHCSGEYFHPGTQTMTITFCNVMSRHYTFGITKDAWKDLKLFALTTSQHHQNLQQVR